MAYLSLYRKYRSQSFAEVSGQEHVTRTLQNALRAERVAHAYLFSGPRGTGKTSTARLLARALNCERGPTPEPCGECVACQEIRDGISPSVIEIDAASSRGIDEIRDLRQRVMTAPSQAGARKVFIVDEVHMLTTEACNALLKTLEEPPAHILFILATTDAQKLPATILSRCQRFEFRRGAVSLIAERLRFVAAEEGYQLEPEAARLVARAASGSWRDAISLLEQVLSYGGSEVTAESVTAVLGGVEEETLLELAEGLARADGRAVYPTIERLVSEGTEPRQLARDLGEHFRALLMADAGALPPDAYSAETARRLGEQAGSFGTQRLVLALEALAQADREMRWSDSGRVVLEVALARLMIGAGRPAVEVPVQPRTAAVPSEQPATAARSVPNGRAAAPPAAVPQRVQEPAPEAAQIRRPEVQETETPCPGQERKAYDPFEQEELPPSVVGQRVADRSPAAPPVRSPVDAGDAPQFEQIRARWNVVVEELKRGRAVVTAALLVEAVPLRCESDTLVIGFRSSTLREKWERGDNKQRLTAALRAVFGHELRSRSEEVGDEAAGDGGGARSEPGSKAQPGPAGNRAGVISGGSAAAVPQEAPLTGGEAASRGQVRSNANGAESLEGEALLHEVIAAFEGQIIDQESV